MNKYYFIFLIWLLPLYFLFQGGYQVATWYGLQNTYENGESYIARVTDFDVKQIASQTNGYVVVNFTPSDGRPVERKLSLSVQMAQLIMDSEMIPVRYKSDSFNPVVMMPTYQLQQSIVKVNIGVLAIGLVVTLLIALWASRYAIRRIRYGADEFEIERVD